MKGFILFISVFALAVAEAPKELTLCRPSDPNLEQCVAKFMGDFMQILNEGVPEYDIPSANPINAPDFILEADPQYTIVNFEQRYSNVKIFNFPLSRATIESASIEENSYSIVLRFTNPLLKTTANFDIPSISLQGQTFSLSGNATIVIDANYLATLSGSKSESNGSGQAQITDLVLTSAHNSISVALESENQEGASTLSNFLAMNQQTIIAESKSRINAYFGPVLKNLANDIFSKIPLKY
ncbi:hypothetical protein RI129_012366 [Pyrocoelia pectoralis]|uniref:Uncharacterized protein n=1 Tax=Pyrocoelia pectoralis TaxID=417401 RepID=A0AAN7V3N3_9COLE